MATVFPESISGQKPPDQVVFSAPPRAEKVAHLINRKLQVERRESKRLHEKDEVWASLEQYIRSLVELPQSAYSNALIDSLLFDLLAIEKASSAWPDSHGQFARTLQLFSLLPVFLKSDFSGADDALRLSVSLLREARVVIDLHRILDHEMIELLITPAFASLHPDQALRMGLGVELTQVAKHMEALEGANIPTLARDGLLGAVISETSREGYWSLAYQLSLKSQNGASHIQVPPQLGLGNISWPRFAESWQKLRMILSGDNALQALDPKLPSDSTNRFDSNSLPDTSCANPAFNEDEFTEIRSSNDTKLAETLAIQLDQAREAGYSVALAVVTAFNGQKETLRDSIHPGLDRWQAVLLDRLKSSTHGLTSRGFVTDSGELCLVIEQLDRNEVTQVLRDALGFTSDALQPASKIIQATKFSMICGVSCVSVPSKGFRMDQLISAAWRCLDAARRHGPNAVKSLEVY